MSEEIVLSARKQLPRHLRPLRFCLLITSSANLGLICTVYLKLFKGTGIYITIYAILVLLSSLVFVLVYFFSFVGKSTAERSVRFVLLLVPFVCLFYYGVRGVIVLDKAFDLSSRGRCAEVEGCQLLAILASASLVATIAYYGHFGRVIAQARENGDLVEEYAGLEWQDYMSIISGVVLFVTYLALAHLIEFWDSAKRLRERYNPNFDDYFVSHNPFSCGDSSDYQYCLAMNSNISIGLIAGVFALVEVAMSLFMSPMKVKTVAF
ncbi:hypothetical protein BGX29_005781 [Mortierella sp. GBA35]|nr:hypothetical protein BGX29_005781 [Mortierella sp. GBA35]